MEEIRHETDGAPEGETPEIVGDAPTDAGVVLQAASGPMPAPGAVEAAPGGAVVAAPAPVASVERGDTWWDTVRSLLVVLAAVLGIRTFVAEATVIPTGSMESTILIGDHVFLNKLLYGPEIPYTPWRLPVLRQIHRGDIVAFHYPRNPSVMFVKRVIAQGGDVVKVIHKQVYVNGKPLYEPYAQLDPSNTMPLVVNFPPSVEEVQTIPAYGGLDPAWAREMPNYIKPDGLHVPQGYFFAMGDNRDNSYDSRYWGFVPRENIIGTPLMIYMSIDAPEDVWEPGHVGERFETYLNAIIHPGEVRWRRLFHIF